MNNDSLQPQDQTPEVSTPQQDTTNEAPVTQPSEPVRATPVTSTQATPIEQSPMPSQPAPLKPLDTAKMNKTGWILFSVATVVTLVGLYYGLILVVTALLFALSGRLGLQSKSKPLATLSLVFCGLILIAFILARMAS